MAIKHFYFVRHGETADNRALVHQSINIPLNVRGKQEANEVASVLSKLPIDTILTSDAERTKETANAISNATNITPRIEPLLREIRRGVLVEGEHHFSWKSIKAGILMFLFAGSRSWHFGNGENVKEFRIRLAQARTLFTKMQGEHIVVVAHRGFINGFRFDTVHKGFMELPWFFLLSIVFTDMKNGSITELTYDNERAGRWKIVRANDTRHLD